MSKTALFLFLTFTALLFLILNLAFGVRKVSAQMPTPVPVPCNEVKNPEFQSTRPYQASPCGDAPVVSYCGGSLVVSQPIEVTVDQCTLEGKEGRQSLVCPVNQYRTLNVSVDLSEASFPILGNSELVKNSQTSTDQIANQEGLDDAQKVNEYASWYLSGVPQNAEYGSSKDSLVPDFSGPIKKILPQVIQEANQIKVIDNAKAEKEHNQIVVCAKEGDSGLFGWLADKLDIGKTKPEECYSGGGTPANNEHVYRLVGDGDNNWSGQLSGWDDFVNKIADAANYFANLIPGTPTDIIKSSLGDHWNKRIPPLPWSDMNKKPFKSDILYRKAYKEWQGNTCIIIPGVEILACIDNPFVSNKYADLFPYVPMADTSDKVGQVSASGIEVAPNSNVEIDNSKTKITVNDPAKLYFAHTQEVRDLSEILQSSFTPKSKDGKSKSSAGIGDGVEPNVSNCHPLNVRTNSGDKLFPGSINIQAEYFVVSLKCPYDPENPSRTCLGDVGANILLNTTTPNAQEIYSNLVAGPTSVFKRIYPKVTSGAPVSCIADIPANSKVNYNVNGSEQPGDIYFPHIGSVYEYFLKGIQTALKPQGYGAGSPISGINCPTSSSGDICQVANKYNIPCCQLKGVEALEGGSTSGGETCSTSHGDFQCCHGRVCGPAQVACGQYEGFAGNTNIDMCSEAGSAELLARAMLLKLCQADKICDSYDWNKYGSYVMKNYDIEQICKDKPDQCYTAAAYFYGLQNGCYPSACTQYRWGPGKSYCDSLKSYCENGSLLPDNTSPQFCEACNQEVVRAGQQPINCSAP